MMMDKPLESGLRGQSKRCTLLNRYGASWREALLFVCLSLLFVPVQAADNVLRNIDFSALPGSSVQITLQADQPITTKPKIFTTDNPPRIALDFFGMTSGLAQKTVPIEVGMARSITAIEAGGRTRVVVNLVKQISNNIEVADDKVIITIAGSSETVAKSGQTAQASTSPVSQKTLARTTSGSQIEGVDFRRGDAGEGKVILQLSDPTAVVDMRQQGSRVILDILKTSLPDQFARKFDVADFATPVKLVEVSSNKNDVHIEISTAGEYDHLDPHPP